MARWNRYIALLRGINVGGHNKIPMAALRSVVGKAGWKDVETYIQSGNLVFTAPLSGRAAEAELERLIKNKFGLEIPILVRSATDWSVYLAGNPFPAQTKATPHYVLLALSKARPKTGAQAALQARATLGEQVRLVENAFWIYFAGGVGRSKLSPTVLERVVGSPVTARNWLTVTKLRDLAGPTKQKIEA